jgi:hypothetical protein
MFPSALPELSQVLLTTDALPLQNMKYMRLSVWHVAPGTYTSGSKSAPNAMYFVVPAAVWNWMKHASWLSQYDTLPIVVASDVVARQYPEIDPVVNGVAELQVVYGEPAFCTASQTMALASVFVSGLARG